MLIDLRSAVSLLEDSPLFLGTYISLEILVGGLGVFFTEEKVVPKLVMIFSSLSILVTPTLDPYWVIRLWIFLSNFQLTLR